MELINFKKLIGSYQSGVPFTEADIDGWNLEEKDGYQLVTSPFNNTIYGEYLVNSLKGCEGYSYNAINNQKYYVIEGTGEFIIDGKLFPVQKGISIVINPNQVFYYSGTMLLGLEMTPNIEKNKLVQEVVYDKPKTK